MGVAAMTAEQRQVYEAFDTDAREIVRLMLDILSDIRPADRLFMLYQIDSAACYMRGD